MTGTSGAQISYPPPAGDVGGYWYTFVGGAGTGGSVTPLATSEITDGATASFYYTGVGAGSDSGIQPPSDAGGIKAAACAWGQTPSGQYAYGAEGFYFASTPVAAGNVKLSVDVSKYTGVQYWIYNALSTATPIKTQITDQESVPDGGYCNSALAPTDGATDQISCNSPAFVDSMVMPGWTFVQDAFAAFMVNQYFGYPQPNGLDTTKVYDVQFQVHQEAAPTDPGGGALPFNFCIADIAFY
jgi:hypothetical protein